MEASAKLKAKAHNSGDTIGTATDVMQGITDTLEAIGKISRLIREMAVQTSQLVVEADKNAEHLDSLNEELRGTNSPEILPSVQ